MAGVDRKRMQVKNRYKKEKIDSDIKKSAPAVRKVSLIEQQRQ
jgi:hypothetical protein